VEPIISRLSRPEVRDTLPANQLLNPFVVFSYCKLSESISSETRERNINLTMERKYIAAGLQNVFQEHQTCDINIAKGFLAFLINKFLHVKSILVCRNRHCEDTTLAFDQTAQLKGGFVDRSCLGRHSTEEDRFRLCHSGKSRRCTCTSRCSSHCITNTSACHSPSPSWWRSCFSNTEGGGSNDQSD